MINQSMLDEFLELVQIPVHSKDERHICDVLKEKLSTLCLLYTSPSPRDRLISRMPSSA